MGLVIDQERCIGCEACTVACKNENQGGSGFIRVVKQQAGRRDLPAGTFPDLRMTFLPLVCNHCERAPCTAACPVEAIAARKDGVVVLDRDACDGCRACVEVCPYGAIAFDEKNAVAEKCNLCVHRIESGLAPFCAVCCEGQAIFFGDLNDPGNAAGRLARSGNTFVLKPEEGTGPSVRYLPPVEPRGV